MAHRPEPIIIEIVGIEEGSRGRSCEEHAVCGSVVDEDVVVRLRKVQLLVDGKEETAIAAYWVTDGEDCCRVGFLQHHMVAYASRYDGALTRVLGPNANMFDSAERQLYHKNKGYCFATIITALTVMEKVEVKMEGRVDFGNGNAKGKGGKKRAAESIHVD